MRQPAGGSDAAADQSAGQRARRPPGGDFGRFSSISGHVGTSVGASAAQADTQKKQCTAWNTSTRHNAEVQAASMPAATSPPTLMCPPARPEATLRRICQQHSRRLPPLGTLPLGFSTYTLSSRVRKLPAYCCSRQHMPQTGGEHQCQAGGCCNMQP
jgi:hypothetical protein